MTIFLVSYIGSLRIGLLAGISVRRAALCRRPESGLRLLFLVVFSFREFWVLRFLEGVGIKSRSVELPYATS